MMMSAAALLFTCAIICEVSSWLKITFNQYLINATGVRLILLLEIVAVKRYGGLLSTSCSRATICNGKSCRLKVNVKSYYKNNSCGHRTLKPLLGPSAWTRCSKHSPCLLNKRLQWTADVINTVRRSNHDWIHLKHWRWKKIILI